MPIIRTYIFRWLVSIFYVYKVAQKQTWSQGHKFQGQGQRGQGQGLDLQGQGQGLGLQGQGLGPSPTYKVKAKEGIHSTLHHTHYSRII